MPEIFNNLDINSLFTQEFSRYFLDTLKDMVFIIAVDGTIIYCNKASEKTGYLPIGLVGMKIFETGLFHGSELSRAKDNFELQKQGILSESNEYEITNEGIALWVEVSSYPIKSSATISGFLYLVKDITEKKRSEKMLMESEKKYRDLFESAFDSILVCSIKGIIIDANNKFCCMLGYSKSELIGRSVFDFYYNKSQVPGKSDMPGLNSLNALFLERKAVSKDGKVLNLEITARLVESNTIIAVIRNMTEIKELKERPRLISERAVRLTENEIKVLHALAVDSSGSDQDISSAIKVKRPTVTAIKNKFLSQSYCVPCSIPSPALINCSRIALTHCRLKRAEAGNKDFGSVPPQVVFLSVTEDDAIFAVMEEDSGKVSTLISDFVSIIGSTCHVESHTTHYFPADAEGIIKYMEFGSLIKEIFLLRVESTHRRLSFNKIKLTKKDRKIVCALCERPNATDIYLSEITGVSRPKVSSFRSAIIGEGLLSCVDIPQIKKIGIRLLVLNIFKLKDNSARTALAAAKQMPFSIFSLLGAREIAIVSLYPDFERYRLQGERLQRNFEKLISDKPKEVLMASDNISRFSIGFTGLVNQKIKNG